MRSYEIRISEGVLDKELQMQFLCSSNITNISLRVKFPPRFILPSFPFEPSLRNFLSLLHFSFLSVLSLLSSLPLFLPVPSFLSPLFSLPSFLLFSGWLLPLWQYSQNDTVVAVRKCSVGSNDRVYSMPGLMSEMEKHLTHFRQGPTQTVSNFSSSRPSVLKILYILRVAHKICWQA